MSGSVLRYALLGLLAREELTGYQLSRRLRNPVGYFWSASHSQVYPELARLEAGGLVAHEVVAGPGPRDTKRYRLTARGRDVLGAWVVTPAPYDEQDEFMLRIYSLWTGDPAAAVAMLRERRQHHEERLAEYERILAEIGPLPDPAVVDETFCTVATLRRGVSFERHARDWCQDLLDSLGAAH